MSYHVYKTVGYVMGGHEKGDTSKLLYILTKDFGLILARAQSIRVLNSKLRYALQSFSHSRVDLVKGKAGWRVVNARSVDNFFGPHEVSGEKRYVVVRITSLLKRLLRGEEQHEELFDEVLRVFNKLHKEHFAEEELRSLEILAVMRVLHLLGYWGEEKMFSHFVKEGEIRGEHLEEVKKVRPQAIREINKALKETQL